MHLIQTMLGDKRLQLLCILAGVVAMVQGHGRLLDPPARTTAFRTKGPSIGGIPLPVDFNDNELYCGGKQVQWGRNGGQCGVCGDNFLEPEPRRHELGGELVKHIIIVETYKAGDVIDVTAEVTANHRGYFEYRLCVRDDHNETPLTHECLNRVLLADTRGRTQHKIGRRSGKILTRLQLPPGVTCQECVLQWKYNTGNDWGICADGTGRLGCSATPEQFYGCSDISITLTGDSAANSGNGRDSDRGADGDNDERSRDNGRDRGSGTNDGDDDGGRRPQTADDATNGRWPTANGGNADDGDTNDNNDNVGMTPTDNDGGDDRRPATDNGNTDSPTDNANRGGETDTSDGNGNNNSGNANGDSGDSDTILNGGATEDDTAAGADDCQPSLAYARVPNMRNWCRTNCLLGYCPRTHCMPSCRNRPVRDPAVTECAAVGPFRNSAGMNAWCQNNCPSYCPRSHCNDICREP